jgi:hypothetical protein
LLPQFGAPAGYWVPVEKSQLEAEGRLFDPEPDPEEEKEEEEEEVNSSCQVRV